jgi:hypothetical protein
MTHCVIMWRVRFGKHFRKLLFDPKSIIFWDITPYSPLSVNRRFVGTYRLEKISTCFHACFFLSLFFRPWRWRRYVPPKLPFTLNGLHSVRTSNPTFCLIPSVYLPPELHNRTPKDLTVYGPTDWRNVWSKSCSHVTHICAYVWDFWITPSSNTCCFYRCTVTSGCSGLLDFWTFPIVRYSEDSKVSGTRFVSVSRRGGGRHLLR